MTCIRAYDSYLKTLCGKYNGGETIAFNSLDRWLENAEGFGVKMPVCPMCLKRVRDALEKAATEAT